MKKILSAIVIVAMVCSLSAPASAVSDSWKADVAANWNVAARWTLGNIPGTGDTATFSFLLTANRNVTVDANRNIRNIDFGNTGAFRYSLITGPLLLDNGGVIQTLAANGNHTDRLTSALEIQGDGGSATFTANATSATSLLNIAAVTGVSTLGNTTTLTLNGTNTGNNNMTGVIGDGAAGGKIALVKNEAGTWTLSGTNTYSGGTTLNAGQLNINDTNAIGTGLFTITTGTIDNTSGNAKTLATDNAQNWNGDFTFTGTDNLNLGTGAVTLGGSRIVTVTAKIFNVGGIIDDGVNDYSIDKQGAGTLTLRGANTYSGGTILTAGELRINNANALGTGAFTIVGGTIDNTSTAAITLATNNTQNWNGDFTFTGSDNLNLGTGAVTLGGSRIVTVTAKTLTVGGIIGGGFSLDKQGAGKLTLSGANTYSGDTTISAGTLMLGADNVIPNGAGKGNVVVTGTGTLDLNNRSDQINGLSGDGTVDHSAGGTDTLTVGDNNATSTFSGIIKNSGGTLKLTKTGTGTVTLNGANTYTGTTTITTGTIQVGNASALGTGAVANVAHNATLDIGSTTLNIGGTYIQGGAATLMVAVNGTTSGSIVAVGKATVTATDSLVLNVTNYVPNNATYTIIDGAAAGAVVAPVITTPGYNNAVFTATTVGDDLILTATRGAANGFAADAKAGDSNASAIGTVLDTITNPSADMQTVLNTLDGLSNSQVAAALDTMVPEVDAGVINTSTTTLNNFIGAAMDRVEQVLTIAKVMDSSTTGISAGEEAKLNGIWAKGYGSYLTQGTRNNIAGYDAWNAGTAIGVDHLFSDNITLGVSGGWAYGNVDGDVNNANTYINSAQTTIYGGYSDPNLPYFIDAAGSFAYNWYNGRRDINIGNVLLRRANAEYDGQQYGVYIGGGYKVNVTKNIEVTPLLSLQWNHLSLGSYTETEAGALNISVNRQGYDQLLSGVGARIASPIKYAWGTFTPEAHGKWFFDFIGDPFAVSSNFNGGGASFNSNGCKPALNSFNAGSQLIFAFKNDISLIANCDTEMKDQFFGIYGSATVRYDF